MTGSKKRSEQALPVTDSSESILALPTLRMQAEALARGQSAASLQEIADLSPEAIQQMFHELQVHRIELEMQNEELRRAQVELDVSRARYLDLYDLAPVGYLTLSAQGVILKANLTAATLLGLDRRALIGQAMSRFIFKDDQDVYYLYHKKNCDACTPHTLDLRMTKQDGTVFWVHLVITIMQRIDDQPLCLLALSDITVHKHLENAQRESEARFRKVLRDVTSVAVQGYGPDGTTQYWNQASEQLYGYSAQEAIGRNLVDLIILPEMREAVEQAIRQMAATGEPIPASELVLLRKDGSRVHVFSSHTLVQVPGHQPELFCIDIDLTARKQAEEALRESEERYRRLFESATEALFLIDIDTGMLVNANRTASEIYGYEPEEFLAKRCADLTAAPEEPCSLIVKIRMAPEEIVTLPLRYHRKKDGTVFPVELTARALPLGGRQVVLVTARDITRRHQAQEALRQSEEQRIQAQEAANAQLKEQAENLASIYQALDSIGLIVCDLETEDGRITNFNPGAEKILGYRMEEVVGKSIALIYPPEFMERISARVKSLRKGQALHSMDVTLVRKSGARFPAVVSVHPFSSHAGQFDKVVGVIRDISDLMQAQEQLQAANNELEQRVEQRTLELQETQKQYLHAEKLSAIGKLSASIAHEFNNPLQGILSILKGLRKRVVLEGEDQELLDAAISESDRIKELIRSLQEFNRPSSGRKVAMDVHKSLEAMLLLHKSDFQSKRISVDLNYAERLPQIFAVPDQIKQVFLNLLTNAADACTRPGAVITVSTRQEGERVAVAIRDTGVGIKPEEMEHIFRPFYTTKSAVKGTGLGLSVSFGIVKRHHGEIRVESQPGQGTTFTVYLPINSDYNPVGTAG